MVYSSNQQFAPIEEGLNPEPENNIGQWRSWCSELGRKGKKEKLLTSLLLENKYIQHGYGNIIAYVMDITNRNACQHRRNEWHRLWHKLEFNNPRQG